MTGKKKSISARMCEIVSDVEHLSVDTIKRVIGEQSSIDKYLYILHDKDVDENGKKKNPHHHVYLHFNNARCFDNVASWFGLSVAFVSKIHGTFADAVEYATHQNAPNKHQYDKSEVTANFDFEKVIESNQERKEKHNSINAIIDMIDSGKIKPYNIVDVVNMQDYVRYKKQIQSAFEYRLKRIERNVNRKMEVIYIWGASGTGKTTYAKMIAEGKGYEVFMSSGSNDPFYNYSGQECVILDDVRGSTFPLQDLLKILDNNTASTVKARYKNISLECDILIITTTKPMRDFYKQVFESHDEEFKQFTRRCGSMCYLTKDTATMYQYDKEKNAYLQFAEVPNPVKVRFVSQELEKKQRKKELMELFGLAVDTAEALQKTANRMKDDLTGFNEFTEILSLDDIQKQDDEQE